MVGLNIAFDFPAISTAVLLSVLTFEYYNVIGITSRVISDCLVRFTQYSQFI